FDIQAFGDVKPAQHIRSLAPRRVGVRQGQPVND
ncbi:MAG: hypothetical protein ACI8W7_001674, partial [Gammaproteobacteria bacterium]